MAEGKSASGRANLFHNDRKDKDSHPDWKGNGEFSSEFIKALKIMFEEARKKEKLNG